MLWQNDLCRVVRVDEPDYPGFCRVILRRHAREMTDLAPAERDALMAVVYAVEEALRTITAEVAGLPSSAMWSRQWRTPERRLPRSPTWASRPIRP